MTDLEKFAKDTADPDVTGCFTVEEYCKKTGASSGTARGILDSAVEKGTLICLKSSRDGRHKNFYKLKVD